MGIARRIRFSTLGSPGRGRQVSPLLGLVALALIVLAGPAASSAIASAPVCTDQEYTVESGQDLALPVNGPCGDADGPNALQGQIVSLPSHGSISPGVDGGGIYRSSAGYTGPDSFTFQAFDGAELSNEATVTIEVTPATGGTQPPQCFDIGAEELGGTGTAFVPSCFDPDTDPSELTLSVVQDFQNGQRSGSFDLFSSTSYLSNPGFSGTDTLTYRASDGVNESNLASVTIQVTPLPEGNLPPTCPESRAYVPVGQSIRLIANCVDPDGDPISYGLTAPFVTGGVIDQFTPNSVRYTPNPGTASDALGYTARDPYHHPISFAVAITVTDGPGPVETAPEATPEEPFAASIESPSEGPVYLDTRSVTTVPPTGFFFLNQEFDIDAPDATDPQDPLRFVFKLDESLLEGLSPAEITVFRNEAPVPDCATPGAGVAEPWPCIDSREVQPDGDLWITALTLEASVWNFGLREGSDADEDGVQDDADNCPAVSNAEQTDLDEDGLGAACDSKEAPTSKDECKKNGWRAFDGIYTFRNQGDCVSFVATGGNNQPNP